MTGGTLTRLIGYPVIAVMALFVFTRLMESRVIFFPTREVTATPADIPLPFEEVWFESPDGVRLNAWFIPRAGARLTILFLHGNAGNIGHRLEKIQILHDLGLSVFIVDYRGYGKSGGRPSERGIRLDSDVAWRYLTETRGLSPETLVVYGESIGGAFAAGLAALRPCGALITEETFTSARDMTKRAVPLPLRVFVSLQLDTLSHLSKVTVPKLIIHSVDDEIVPYKMGERLFAAAPEPKTFLRLRGGHNTAFLDSEALYQEGLADFLKRFNI